MAPMIGLEQARTARAGFWAGSVALAAPMPSGSLDSSFRSRPAVNARSPAPVRTITRTSGSASSSTMAVCSAARSALDSAFIASGRFRVTTATPSRGFSTSSMAYSFARRGMGRRRYGRQAGAGRWTLPPREKLAKHRAAHAARGRP